MITHELMLYGIYPHLKLILYIYIYIYIYIFKDLVTYSNIVFMHNVHLKKCLSIISLLFPRYNNLYNNTFNNFKLSYYKKSSRHHKSVSYKAINQGIIYN